MRIYHAAAEIAPIAKVGGLADVIYGLSRAQIEQGLDVTVILPKYDFLQLKLKKVKEFTCHYGSRNYNNTLWKGKVDGIPLLLIDPHHPRMWFSRGAVYVTEDDPERFLYFCRAIYDYLAEADTLPDILHLHDWQLGALAVLQDDTKKVFTIHNFYHQGKCRSSLLKTIGIKPEKNLLDGAQPKKANLLKCGIVASDRSNTVSPTYAEEVLTSKMGFGMEKVLRKQRDKFSGILNGIDYDYWNPETDPLIPHNFSSKKMKNRAAAKRDIREQLGLRESKRPLLAVISRLVPQKGVNLIADILRAVPEMGGQFVLLGSSPLPDIEEEFEELADEFAGHPDIHLELTYDEELSHRLYAGADMLAVPSLFEPCGLTQMIALRYGCVPIVRATGGLADTVIEGENGFTFEDATPDAFALAVDRAFDLWRNDRKEWKKLQHRGMCQDFSWKTSAAHYLDMYQSI